MKEADEVHEKIQPKDTNRYPKYMKGKSIRLFMWGYQQHFRICCKHSMNDVLKALGILDTEFECLLVGAKIPDRDNPNEVCIEPEDGKWSIDIFDGLLDEVEAEVANHPIKDVIYGDKPSMDGKPEKIRRDSVRRVVQKMLHAFDLDNDIRSFAGQPSSVNDYYVVPVLQLPRQLFERFRPLREPVSDGYFTHPASLIHAAISEVLTSAYDELQRPEPGSDFGMRSRSTEEIVHRAATSFMYTPGLAIGDNNHWRSNMFERFNLLSSLMYEGATGVGRLILAKSDAESIDITLKFAVPVPFSEPRWARKVLQMVSSESALVADCEKIFGLGKVTKDTEAWTSQNIFEVEFLDHYHWRLICGSEVMLVSKYGVPSLPQEEFPIDRLRDTYQRLFAEVDSRDIDHFITLFKAAVKQRHGSMVIVAKDAELEADRLSNQGTRIEPTKLTAGLYRQVSAIDGTVIIDPHGVCYAIGVILDGQAQSECTPSRGARYNSGIRYIKASNNPRLAVIVSDDQTVDVIPILRPRIKRSEIDDAISSLEIAGKDDYHQAMKWLDTHRFYLSQEQCDRINAVLTEIHNEPMEVGELRINWKEFTPDPLLDDSYFENEDAIIPTKARNTGSGRTIHNS